jgi:hypothetical protein
VRASLSVQQYFLLAHFCKHDGVTSLSDFDMALRRSVGPKSLLPNELSKQCGYPTGNDDFFSGFLGFANAAWAACSTAPFFGQVNEDQQTYMNMMFVAYDDVADSYFIGIAGTNGMSGLLIVNISSCCMLGSLQSVLISTANVTSFHVVTAQTELSYMLTHAFFIKHRRNLYVHVACGGFRVLHDCSLAIRLAWGIKHRPN